MIMQANSTSPLVAVIDGSSRDHRKLVTSLLPFFRVAAYADARSALFGFRSHQPQVVVVDDTLGRQNGCDIAHTIREDRAGSELPIVLVGTSADFGARMAAEVGGITACIKMPIERNMLVNTVSSVLNASVEGTWDSLPVNQKTALKKSVTLFRNIARMLEREEAITYSVVQDACQPLVMAVRRNDFRGILKGVQQYDNYSYVHSLRVATLLSLLGYGTGLNDDEVVVLSTGGLLHDVGKMAIPHAVLNKPGKLNAEEWRIMKSHVAATVRYLEASGDVPAPVLAIAWQHHEKLDGTGYPRGLAGAQINELTRMAAIVDVFSALTDRRVYRPALTAEHALKLMTGKMKHHLDQHLLAMFTSILLDLAIET
jgi:HD-GYP domain-containing protein (c-di-GMP phosphodiesterase class II)